MVKRINVKGPVEHRMKIKDKKRRWLLDVLYEMLSDGPRQMSDAIVADYLRARGEWTEGLDIHRHLQSFREMGVFESTVVYGDRENKLGPGRHATWRLVMSRSEAGLALGSLEQREIAEARDNRANGNRLSAEKRRGARYVKVEEPVVTTANSSNETVVRLVEDTPVEAISGPDAPSPFSVLAEARKDESYAIVEAARQYADRDSKVTQQIEALLSQARDLGLTVDEHALRGSITTPTDDRLEAIALALPYIERLERRIGRLESDITKLKGVITENDKEKRELLALRRQNQQLLARQVAN